MNKGTFVHIFFMAIGIFGVLGAFFKWNLLYNSKLTRKIIQLFGESGARIFYTVMGCAIFLIALLDMADIIDVHLLFGKGAALYPN